MTSTLTAFQTIMVPAFTDQHMETENEIVERGLHPRRVRFTIHLHKVQVLKPFCEKTFVVSLERKSASSTSAPGQKIESKEDEFLFADELEMYSLVSEKTPSCFSGDSLTEGETDAVERTESRYEKTIALIVLRHENADGPVLDCGNLDLSEYLRSQQIKSSTTLHLQLGCSVEMTVVAQLLNGVENTELVATDWGLDDVTKTCVSEEHAEFVKIDLDNDNANITESRDLESTETHFQIPENEADEEGLCVVDLDRADENQPSDASNSSGSCPITSQSVGDDVSLNDSTAAKLEGSTHTAEGSTVSENKSRESDACEDEPVEKPEEKHLTLKEMKHTRGAGDEYRTKCSSGTWVEDASIVEIHAPHKVRFWGIHGPDEYECDDDDSDSEAEEPPRKKHVMTISTTKPGPPAAPGKMSVLQKSVMTLETPAPAYSLDLGPPVSFYQSSVLAATRFLWHDAQHIEEPMLSDLEAMEDEVENDRSSETGSVKAEAESQLVMTECPNGEISALGAASVETSGLKKLPEPGEDRVDELTFQLREMEKYIRQLQVELEESKKPSTKISQSSRDEEECFQGPKILANKARSQSHKLGESEPSLYRTDGRRRSSHSRHGSSSSSFDRKESVLTLQKELQEEREKSATSQREHARLHLVIKKLQGELDREPEMMAIVNELSEAKVELALERAKRQKLEKLLQDSQSAESRKENCSEKKKGMIFGYTPSWPKSPRAFARKTGSDGSLSKELSEDFVSPKSVLI